MLTEVFGDYPQVRVLEVLIANPTKEFTKSDIADQAKISRATLYRFWENLERHKVVKVTRRIANSQLFVLNGESPLVEGLMKFPTPSIRTVRPSLRMKKQIQSISQLSVQEPSSEETGEKPESVGTDAEKQKAEIREFLRQLEDYYAAGTLSETAYQELKEKNLRKLEDIGMKR